MDGVESCLQRGNDLEGEVLLVFHAHQVGDGQRPARQHEPDPSQHREHELLGEVARGTLDIRRRLGRCSCHLYVDLVLGFRAARAEHDAGLALEFEDEDVPTGAVGLGADGSEGPAGILAVMDGENPPSADHLRRLGAEALLEGLDPGPTHRPPHDRRQQDVSDRTDFRSEILEDVAEVPPSGLLLCCESREHERATGGVLVADRRRDEDPV